MTRAIICVLLLAAISPAAEPKHPKPIVETFTGKVISVADADTISVLKDKRPVRIRLEGIDAPESGQEHGNKAKQALSKMIHGEIVKIEVTGTDRYQRLLAVVRFHGDSINEQLVKDGWAWHFKEYNSDPTLARLEVEARKAKVGLWAHANPIPPWEYRELQRKLAEIKKAKQAAEQDTARGPPVAQKAAAATVKYWLNTSSNTRHNNGCRWYGKTKRGRPCGPDDGKACGICGG